MKKILIAIIVLLSLVLIVLGYAYKKQTEDYYVSLNNNKAHEQKDIQYQNTIRELQASNDSIVIKCLKLADSLKIKQKKLKEIVYVESKISKVDTIRFQDTIFVENMICDTLLKDDWYSMSITMMYPNIIVASPSFVSKKTILHSTKRETINPPRKFFLFRLFQKKHNVTKVTVLEENPYIINEGIMSIDIIDR